MAHFINRLSSFWNSHHSLLQYLLIILAAYFLFFWLQSAPVLSDPDSFYHAKIAQILANGKILHEFPWLQFTTLKDNFTDHHFLYHIFLIPFVSLFPDPLAGLKFSVVVIGTMVFTVIFWFLKSNKVPFSFALTLILLAAGPYLFRANLAKAPILSLAVLIVGLQLMFRKKYIPLFFLSFFYVWLYGGWMLLGGAAVVYTIIDAIISPLRSQSEIRNPKFETNSKFKFSNFKTILYFVFWLFDIVSYFVLRASNLLNIKLLGIVFLGLLAGLIINPYFPDNIAFTWQQAVKIGLINYQNIIGVGGEWYPYKIFDLIGGLNLIFIIMVGSLAIFLATLPKQTSKSLTLFVFTAIFFILTLKSKRNIEYFTPFAILFSGFALRDGLQISRLALKNLIPESIVQKLTYGLIIGYIAVMAVPSAFKEIANTKRDLSSGTPFAQFKGIGNWLKTNTPKGSIVLHSDWDESPVLFYQNDWNYYIVGLDPTFMYEYNKDLYWKWVNITTGKGVDDMTKVIKNELRVQYVLATSDHQDMDKLFKNNEDFEKMYEDEEGKIYKIKDL
ncbi:MAG TPA: hypothetical protein VI998_00960 [Patescibacteria group bacterium]|nr:hypothetical protein [Patescibacteria group bacterium]